MTENRGTTEIAGGVLAQYRTPLDEEKLRTAPMEARAYVPHYRDILALARAELADLEAGIENAKSVGESDRLKWKASQKREMIKTLWISVGPYQAH